MEADPHPERPGLAQHRPVGRRQPALDFDRRPQRVLGGDEGGAEGVADRLEDVAAVDRDDVTQQGVMALESDLHGRTVALPQIGAALDVAEQERDGAGR